MTLDTELAILKAVVDNAAACAGEGDLDQTLSCLVAGLAWARRTCAAGRSTGDAVIRRYARRWVARERALRRSSHAEALDAAAVGTSS